MDAILLTILFVAVGAGLGYASALAFKSAARTLGCLIVVLFLAVEVLSYYQVIDINPLRLLRQVGPHGQIAGQALEGGARLFTYNMPLAVAFGLGFLLGLRQR